MMEMHEEFFKHKFPVAESSPPPAVGNYEAWRISYQSSEQAARAAFREAKVLREKLRVAEEALGECWQYFDDMQEKTMLRISSEALANIRSDK